MSSAQWKGAQGLAEDVRYYGRWMREEAEKRIGHLYPKIEVTSEMVRERPDLKQYEGRKLTVIAWLWARTVKSPNPAFSRTSKCRLPRLSCCRRSEGRMLMSSRWSKERGYRFRVRVGKPEDLDAAKRWNKTFAWELTSIV